jgi:hypothetical protein
MFKGQACSKDCFTKWIKSAPAEDVEKFLKYDDRSQKIAKGFLGAAAAIYGAMAVAAIVKEVRRNRSRKITSHTNWRDERIESLEKERDELWDEVTEARNEKYDAEREAMTLKHENRRLELRVDERDVKLAKVELQLAKVSGGDVTADDGKKDSEYW